MSLSRKRSAVAVMLLPVLGALRPADISGQKAGASPAQVQSAGGAGGQAGARSTP